MDSFCRRHCYSGACNHGATLIERWRKTKHATAGATGGALLLFYFYRLTTLSIMVYLKQSIVPTGGDKQMEQQQQRLERQQTYIYAFVVRRQERLENGVFAPYDDIICRRCGSTLSKDERRDAGMMRAADIERFFEQRGELPICSSCGTSIGKTAHRRAAAQAARQACQQG
jgi:hypothetical protein